MPWDIIVEVYIKSLNLSHKIHRVQPCECRKSDEHTLDFTHLENCSGVAEDAALNRGDNTAEFGSGHAALKLLEVGAFLYKKKFCHLMHSQQIKQK